MLNVGLTGGIATGKSTVVRMLVGKGARVIDHDGLVHTLQEPGQPVWKRIVEAFGRDILGADERIDRKKLGSLVFDDEQRRRTLEGIVHPAVLEEAQRRRDEIAHEDGQAIVLSDIPLLLEVGMKDLFDLILLVYAPPEVQIRRVMKRNKMTRDEAVARLKAQMPIDEKLGLADVVIRNDGTMRELEQNVDEVWQELLSRERAKKRVQGPGYRVQGTGKFAANPSFPRPETLLQDGIDRIDETDEIDQFGEVEMIGKNVKTDFSSMVCDPVIDPTAYVHPMGAVIGNVIIGKNVFVAPFAAVRGDEGQPLHVGDDSNVQDGVVIHALETEEHGKPVEKNLMAVNGKKYAVYVGNRVSLAHQVQIHGPAVVLDDTFVGMKVLVFRSNVGKNCVVEPGCILMGVSVPDGRYVPAGTVLRDQAAADKLPAITDDYPLKNLNKGVCHVNKALAKGYAAQK